MQLSLLCFNGGNMVDLVGFVRNKINDKRMFCSDKYGGRGRMFNRKLLAKIIQKFHTTYTNITTHSEIT